MSDDVYFLLMILFPVVCILGLIYLLTAKRYKPSNKREKKTIAPTSAQDMEREFDDDPVINPGYSSLKSNIFHKDRYDD
jgi:hypothetical protein